MLAAAPCDVLRQLTARFDVSAAPDGLVSARRQAVANATALDARATNHNFAYDDEVYREVKRNQRPGVPWAPAHH